MKSFRQAIEMAWPASLRNSVEKRSRLDEKNWHNMSPINEDRLAAGAIA